MLTKVKKWGNSLGVRIPKIFAEESKIKDGFSVDINYDGEKITIKPLRKIYSLSDLINKIKPKNIHNEINSGDYMGKEIW